MLKWIRPVITESTALDSAYLADLKAGVWKSEDLTKVRKTEKKFSPQLNGDVREKLYNNWKKAVERTFNWAKD